MTDKKIRFKYILIDEYFRKKRVKKTSDDILDCLNLSFNIIKKFKH